MQFTCSLAIALQSLKCIITYTLDCLIHILTILGEQNKEGIPQGDKLEQKILIENFSNDTLYVVLVSIKRNNTLWNSSNQIRSSY